MDCSTATRRTRGADADLTLNYGLRWEVQLPFTPVTDTYSIVDARRPLRHLGHRDGVGGRQCNLFQPGNLAGGGVVRSYTPFDAGDARLQHRLEQLRAERRRRVAAERAGRLAARAARRSGAGDAARRLLAELQPRAHGSVHRASTATTRAARRSANRNVDNGNLVLPGRDLAAAAARPEPPRPAGDCPAGTVTRVRARRTVVSDSATTANNVNIFDPNIQTPHVARRGRSASSARSAATRRSKSATSATATRTPGRPRTGTSANIFENGFLDEFKLAQANLRAQRAAAPDRGGTFAYTGRHRHVAAADLPRLLQRVRPTRPAMRRRYTSTQLRRTPRGPATSSSYEPDPHDAANDLHDNATFRRTRSRRAWRRTSS